jgi:hypothetical protein
MDHEAYPSRSDAGSLAGALQRVQGNGMETKGGSTNPIHTFHEPDYRFGTGPLRMTIERVDWTNPVLYDGEAWYEVVGVEQTQDGRDVGRRRALVKNSQLSSLPRRRSS